MLTVNDLFNEVEIKEYLFEISKFTTSNIVKSFIRERQFRSKKEVKTQYKVLELLSNYSNAFPEIDLFSNSIEFFKKLRLEGSYFDKTEIIELYNFLVQIKEINTILTGTETSKHFNIIKIDEITRRIQHLFDLDEGDIKRNATKELKKLNDDHDNLHYGIKKRIEQLQKKYEKRGYLNEDYYTLKDEHFVLPISSSHKNQVEGIIHSYSNTGFTAYIEPLEVVNASNKLISLDAEIKREKVKILMDLAKKIRPYREKIITNYEDLLIIAEYFTMMRFLKNYHYAIPEISQDFKIIDGKHPILDFESKAVPFNFKQKNFNIFVITGPNTGGKTVLLKTVSIMVILVKMGLPIPCEWGSAIPYFKNVILDIRDNQNVKNALSTFSSHLVKLKKFLIKGDKDTFCAFDEPASGTESTVSDAFSIELIDEAIERESFLIMSSHSINVKNYVQKKENVEIGAMLYDIKNFIPTYKLEMGLSGESYAIEVANNNGIPQNYLDKVNDRLGKDYYDLKKEKSSLQERLLKLEEQEKKYKELIDSERELKKELETRLKRVKGDLKREYEDTINELKEGFADLKRNIAPLKKAQKTQLEEKISKNKEKIKKLEKKGKKTEVELEHRFKLGQLVKLENSSNYYKIIKLAGEDITIQMGELFLQITADMIEDLKEGTAKEYNNDYSIQKSEFHAQIDVRGKTLKEALEEVEKLLNNAFVSNVSMVKILHGKGTGVLRQGISEYLSNHPLVKDYNSEMQGIHINEGVTDVFLEL
ncbi:Smr/MutS family protein [bacterium]|nr:Smr/MutS family protein [bacterium]